MDDRRCPKCGLVLDPLRQDCPYCGKGRRPVHHRRHLPVRPPYSSRKSAAKALRLALVMTALLCGAQALVVSQGKRAERDRASEAPAIARPTGHSAGSESSESSESAEQWQRVERVDQKVWRCEEEP
jgi:hypothetical protein